MANKYRTGVTNFLQQGCRIGYRQFKMFGSNLVSDLAGFGEIAYMDECTAIFERCRYHFFARLFGEQASDAVKHTGNQVGIGRKQNRLCHFVMLGLREHIHRHPIRIRAGIGYYQYF